MGTVIQFKQKPKPMPEEVVAAHNAVEHLRGLMRILPNEKSRVEFALMIMAQLTLWLCKSRHYDNPAAVVIAWVTKKANLYSKETKEG